MPSGWLKVPPSERRTSSLISCERSNLPLLLLKLSEPPPPPFRRLPLHAPNHLWLRHPIPSHSRPRVIAPTTSHRPARSTRPTPFHPLTSRHPLPPSAGNPLPATPSVTGGSGAMDLLVSNVNPNSGIPNPPWLCARLYSPTVRLRRGSIAAYLNWANRGYSDSRTVTTYWT